MERELFVSECQHVLIPLRIRSISTSDNLYSERRTYRQSLNPFENQVYFYVRYLKIFEANN